MLRLLKKRKRLGLRLQYIHITRPDADNLGAPVCVHRNKCFDLQQLEQTEATRRTKSICHVHASRGYFSATVQKNNYIYVIFLLILGCFDPSICTFICNMRTTRPHSVLVQNDLWMIYLSSKPSIHQHNRTLFRLGQILQLLISRFE